MTTDISKLKDYLGKNVNKNHIESAKSKLFFGGESLIAAFKGSDPFMGVFKEYLIVTNLRVIFWKRGITEVIQSFNFEDIASVGQSKSLVLNVIELNVKGAKEIFTDILDPENLAVTIIREQIQKTKNKSTITGESIPDQIKTLADLRDRGILTAREFSDKKTELMKRI